MSQIDQTSDEFLDTLTGHEEMWIADQFGQAIGGLLASSRSMYTRALIFIVKRREGINDDDARNMVMEMRLGDVVEFFLVSREDDEEATVKAVEESGKGEPEPEPLPEPSLSSVS